VATTVPPIQAPAGLPDTRGVALASVAGTEPGGPAVTVRGGDAELVGEVTGPEGAVAGAQVLLERFVGDERAELVVRTDRDGRFRALKIFGGRYRLRAWRAPDLAVTLPELRFVPDAEETDVRLVATTHGGLTVQAVVSSRNPVVDDLVTVTALVTSQRVDGRGIVVAPAAVDRPVRLITGSGWAIDGEPGRIVDGDGRASWTVRCANAGAGSIDVSAGEDAVVTVDVSCVEPPEEPDVPVVDPEPDPDFAVGNRFSAPYPPELPAGRYDVVEGPGTCGVTFQRYIDGAWSDERETATGADGFEVETPIRDVRLLGDSTPCLYERVA
jgi:hypothetical protein